MPEKITFRVAEHSKESGVKVIECLKEGKVVATLFPTDKGMKILSEHVIAVRDPEKTMGAVFVDCIKSPPEIFIEH